MIYELRKRFVVISAISVTVAFLIIFCVVYYMGTVKLNDAMDLLTDGVRVKRQLSVTKSNSETIVPNSGGTTGNSMLHYDIEDAPGFLTEETAHSTRFFIAYTDKKEVVAYLNLNTIASVDEPLAKKYVAEAFDDERSRGWIDNFRYKVLDTNIGSVIVFVDGSMNRAVFHMIIFTAAAVLFFSDILVVVAIWLMSKKIVMPIAKSYERQKQFVTDANHELKTPLSLILANADIAEKEVGKNEWIDDIRVEGKRMSLLINQLVSLSRMDEEALVPLREEFSISDAVLDTISEFSGRAQNEGKKIVPRVAANLTYIGDEGMIRQLIAILLDNAVKYSDENSDIMVSLSGKKRITFVVENSYKNVNEIDFSKLFDRFFRADRVRTYSGSFGVGLSIAKSIVGKHHGDISAYKKNSSVIGFKVVLK